jgi:hypothetical protein
MSRKQERLDTLTKQVQQLASERALLSRQSGQYANIRLISFFLAAVVSGATLVFWGIWPWLGVTVIALTPFVVAVYRHRRIDARLDHSEIILRLKRTHIARMTLDWERIPTPLPIATMAEHPFALDLDLVGERSLHHLLDTAVSLEGSQRLCNWLLNTEPDPSLIAQRQVRIAQIAELTDFRDELIFHATQLTTAPEKKWPGKRMLDWLESQDRRSSLRPALQLLLPLAVANITLGLLNTTGILAPWWVVTWLVFVSISFAQARKIGPLFQEAFFLRDGLAKLSQVFDFLETYDYNDKHHLRALCQPFLTPRQRPSLQLKRVIRIVAAVALQRNQFLWLLLNALVPWDIFFAHQLNQHKKELRVYLPAWLDTWFELETLNSLANFVYLNPEIVFPEITSSPRPDLPVLYAAQALGHPLLPDKARVCNDFNVNELGSIYLITGSNMAGKSTFLRTLGINLALAYAGGPVIATRLRISLFRLFTVIRVSDSVVDGFSYFYAEVHRLKRLLQELEKEEALPLFFLVDEIFRGTNNRERLIGSRAYVRALAGAAGVGVIATHDLELVKLADEIRSVTNYHFRDEVQEGKMKFDYKLHDGPCPTTNALKIMQQAGLPVSLPKTRPSH